MHLMGRHPKIKLMGQFLYGFLCLWVYYSDEKIETKSHSTHYTEIKAEGKNKLAINLQI